MKAALLDTHALLWFVFDDPRLSSRAASLIEDRNVEKLLGIASLWEIVIKCQIGKLRLGMPTADFFAEHITSRRVEVVDIELSHLLAYELLPLHHRDPFDRLLVAQAIVLDVPLVSGDPAFASYGVTLIW